MDHLQFRLRPPRGIDPPIVIPYPEPQGRIDDGLDPYVDGLDPVEPYPEPQGRIDLDSDEDIIEEENF